MSLPYKLEKVKVWQQNIGKLGHEKNFYQASLLPSIN
jgi:hypothetical protein